MKLITALAGIMACGLLSTPSFAQNAGMNGKWKINLEKSQGPQAATEILTYEVTADEEHYIVDEVEKDGRTLRTEFRAKFDGKEYPNKNLVTGKTNYVVLRKVFDHCEQLTNIRHVPGPNGTEVSEVTGSYIRILSPDEKQYTSILVNPKGEVTSVRVFDKISGSGK